jgi:trigger factor
MIRESQASYEDVEGAVKEGDFVKAEYKVIDETGTEGESRANFFVIKKEDPYYVLSQNFEGKEIGTNGDVEVDFPEDYPDKALAGQKKKVRFTIQEGKRVAYPELNDEFAKKLGNDSLDALKQGIEKNIKKKMEEQEILETADRIYDALIEKSKFSIAPSIILQQAQNDMTQQVNNLIRQGKTMEQYLQEEGLDQQQFVEKMKTDAVENIKKYLIVEKIAEANEVKIDDKAVDEFIEKMIELEATNQDQIRNYYKQNQQAKEGVKERLKFLKVAELVQEKAQISGTEKKKLGEE